MQPNRTYGIEISGVEVDPSFDDDMGRTTFSITQHEFWREGRHTERGTLPLNAHLDDILNTVSFSEGLPRNDFGWQPAHYSVEFEIRRVPLPDLVAQGIRPVVLDDGRTVFCTTVANVGQRDAGPFRRVKFPSRRTRGRAHTSTAR